MIRYTKLFIGSAWIDEFGDPEIPTHRKALLKYSPYHNVLPSNEKKYPPMFISTSTTDDRVHPGHAKKMVAKMQEQGHSVLYYEFSEAGHRFDNLKERAKVESYDK